MRVRLGVAIKTLVASSKEVLFLPVFGPFVCRLTGFCEKFYETLFGFVTKHA